MKNDEIKQANRKALPKFLLFAVVCAIVGGVIGYYSGHSAAKGGILRNKYGLYGFSDCACGLCTRIQYWIPALAYGLPRLDRQHIGVLQGGNALLQSWE